MRLPKKEVYRFDNTRLREIQMARRKFQLLNTTCYMMTINAMESGPEFIDQEVTGYFRFIENEFTKKEKNGRGTSLAINVR